jgi:cardiolipin synthase (CMP-forming)
VKLAQLPNLICVMRLALVPPVAWAILGGRHGLALILLLVAAVSDALDGYLARRFGWITVLGQVLDPAADKLLLVTVFVSLAMQRHLPAWLCLTAVARDVVIAGGALVYRRVADSWGSGATGISKLNTALQLGFLSVVLLRAYDADLVPAPLPLVLGAAVFLTTVVSGIDYVLTYASLAGRRGLVGR